MLEESRFIRFVAYGTSMVILSELIYYGHCWLKSFQRKCNNTIEINEVLWTNELSDSCKNSKVKLKNKRSERSALSFSLVNVVKSPPAHKCNNIYCSKYNIARLVQFIDATEYSIDLAMYTFTAYDLYQAFQRAVRRGVHVRILSDHEMAYSSGSQIFALTKLGVPVRCNTNFSIMHHKFCVLNSPLRFKMLPVRKNCVNDTYKVESVLISGSLNWTAQGFCNNWENVLITSNAILVEKYAQEFQRLWEEFQVNFSNERLQ